MQESKLVSSVYIHIPFCKNICSYCDFCKNIYNKKIVADYLDVLKQEIKDNYKKEELNTLYIGGGTPSCLSDEELDKLFDITSLLNFKKTYEFTFECNYEDITENLLIKLKNNKVNRLSIGIQTLNKNFSSFLDRNIDKEEIIKKVFLAKKYFNNINIDLMYAIEGETMQALKQDINDFLQLDVQHISTYALIKEEHTKLSVMNFSEVDDELQSKMYYEIVNKLIDNGYYHYEVSNFAKLGYESRHNMVYWNNENYYGFGAGASGFINNIRYDNTRSIFKYINGNKIVNKETLSLSNLMYDEVMLGLRKTNGINKMDFKNKYGTNLCDVFNYKSLLEKGLIKEEDTSVFISKEYLFVENEIIIQFLETEIKN